MISYYGIIKTSAGRFAIVLVRKPKAVNGRPQLGTQTATGKSFAKWDDAVAEMNKLNATLPGMIARCIVAVRR